MGVLESLPNILKENRKKNEWTQKEIAKKVGVSRSYYSDIENGRTIPSGKTLIAINEVIPLFLIINDADRMNLRERGEEDA